MPQKMNVFVSRPTWLHEIFRPGLETFLKCLADFQLIPRTLGATDYPVRAPLDEVIRIMSDCQGAVILGYPQIQVNAGTLRDQPISQTISLPTEWNHMEATLAYANRIPLLVVHHTGIRRGIFDRGALNSFLFEHDLTNPAWSINEDMAGAIRAWRDEVLGFNPAPREERGSTFRAIELERNSVWTVMATGRRIVDSRPVSRNHRESSECRVEELTEFYVRIHLLGSGIYVTIPLGDIVVSYDDRRYRPMMELRA